MFLIVHNKCLACNSWIHFAHLGVKSFAFGGEQAHQEHLETSGMVVYLPLLWYGSVSPSAVVWYISLCHGMVVYLPLPWYGTSLSAMVWYISLCHGMVVYLPLLWYGSVSPSAVVW